MIPPQAPLDGAIIRSDMDNRDLAIVAALQRDGRATFAEIGRAVGLAASSVHQRGRRLEAHGAIRGYRAEVDPQALGLFVTAPVCGTPRGPRHPHLLADRV